MREPYSERTETKVKIMPLKLLEIVKVNMFIESPDYRLGFIFYAAVKII